MEEKMFCYQCEEAINCQGCSFAGACGKKPELSNKMDVFKDALKELSKVVNGTDNKEVKRFIMHGLFKVITNANFDQEVFEKEIAQASKYYSELTNTNYEFKIEDDSWKKVGTLAESNEDIRGLKEFIITGLMGVAAYHAHAINLGYEDEKIHDFCVDILARLKDMNDVSELLEVIDQVGACGVSAMAILDTANTKSYGSPEITEVKLGVNNRPGILVSGHDLHDMKQLLEQSKDAGIDIYTHSEMLPTHYYPELKKYDHLYGNYGNAWWQQTTEFTTFNGPILFTTNCIVPPTKNANYADKVYTTGDAGYPGFIHVEEDENGNKDFSAIIEHAKKCAAPIAIEEGTITGGFAHDQVFALLDTVVDNIKNGSIRKFIVMGGCDGRFKERDYYKEFAESLADDTIILTAGCAKYRYNKLNLGDINGIPRVLDAGQCNDSYSLALIAMKLKETFGAESFSDLPLEFNIAWYEQKAVIVLLALLHLGFKNIKVGPTLPAFATETITNVLVENFGISGITTVEEDIKNIG
ncbi:hydroxylamine reductase [Mycoplasma sp. P36-A1]|uniref:hydroxylamine reductase n=1 Tax=Mycoplasma sp. P36-A1 TaxID=3252900 RepID=UPI003C302F9C